MEEYDTIKYRRIKQVSVIVAIVALVAIGFILGDKITDFVKDPEVFRAWIQATGPKGVIAFACMNMVQVFLAVVPGGPLVIAAGYVFGPVKGTLLCVCACSCASVIVMLLVRRFGMKLVALFVSPEQLKLVEDYDKSPENAKRIERLLMLIFVIPGTPKDPLTYIAGLTKIPVPVWAAVNFLGRFPGAFISAFTGSAFGSGKGVVIIAAVGGVVILGVVGSILKKAINTEERKDDISA